MQELIENIIEKLEENSFELGKDSIPVHYVRLNKAIEIVKQASAEYTSTEHINCSSDSSTNGWIPCSEPPKDDRYVIEF